MEVNKIEINKLKKASWSEQDVAKAEFVIAFVQKIMNDHDFDYIREKYAEHRYKQHNRTMTDGISGVVEAMSHICERFPEFSYDVRHIYVDGDYVTLQSHVTLFAVDRANHQKGLNIYDTWKVVDEQIVEHWDSVEGIDEAAVQSAQRNVGVVRNENTPF
ncbi:MAG: ester cyclase [Bacteroidia bacterium]|nr:ester cyclase [Bacteroidia bacterium]